MGPIALLAYLYLIIYFSVRCTKDFDSFSNSLILLNIILLINKYKVII